MSVIFYRGQQLGREDLTIFFTNSNGTPANAAEITYALYDFTTGQEVLVGPPQRAPQNPAVGEYFASLLIPLDANLGLYRIRWTFREVIGGPVQQVVQEFTLGDRNAPSPTQQTYSSAETDLIRRFRILLRDNCVAGEEEVELDVDGEKMVVTMEDLWESVHDLRPAEKIRNAFSSRNLKVRSVSPDGTLEWRPVLAVHRAEVPGETIVEIKTTHGPMTLTGGHRVFVSPTQKVEAEQLLVGQTVWGLGSTRTVVQVMRVPNRRYMYDLTADEWHNFILYRSGVLISNSPDRNYRFRPPAHEKTVNQFNQVFGYIWEDDELKEYLERSLDSISLAPPYTPFQSIDNLVSRYPAWRTLLLTGGMIHALQAVRLNWISEEFSYSVGGISLDLEKSSKYEGALSTAVDQFDKQLEKAKQTVNVVRGLQQPRYGVGIRSSLGPYSGKGVLSPRKFVGLVIPLVFASEHIFDLFFRGLQILA